MQPHLKSGSYLCYGSGRHSGVGPVVWRGFVRGTHQDAFQPIRVKDPGAHHLDHGVSGRAQRIFPGNGHHGAHGSVPDFRTDCQCGGQRGRSRNSLWRGHVHQRCPGGKGVFLCTGCCGRHHWHRGRRAHGLPVFYMPYCIQRAGEKADGPGGCVGEDGELPKDILCAHHHRAAHCHQQRHLQLLQCGGQLSVRPGHG